MTELREQIYGALNGNHPNRDGVEVDGEYNGNPREVKTLNPHSFNIHFKKPCPDAKTVSERCGPGARLSNTNSLEAMVLIPEDAGQATIKRVYWDEGGVHGGGFLTPTYTEEGISSLIDAYARKFSDEGEIFTKSWMINPILNILPNEIKRFGQHRDRIIAGIKNSNFFEKNGYDHNDAGLENLAYFTGEMGIVNATDKEFMNAFWEKIKESPNGYVGTGAWGAVAEYVMQNNPQRVMESDWLKSGVAHCSLPDLLWAIPVNQKGGEKRIQRSRKRGNLSEKIYAPIIETIEKTISQ